MSRSIPHRSLASLAVAAVLAVSLFNGAAAQVATLAEPDPDAEATPAAEVLELDGQEAVLEWAACMRENGIDMDDPQFGAGGGRFGLGPGGGNNGESAFDPRGAEFQSAMENCGDVLQALRPDLDATQQAEQADNQLELAQCMRDLDWDFPDPDPNSGFGQGRLTGDIDPFDPTFQEDITACQGELGIELFRGGPPA
jgi:hypothetical protein